LKRLRLLPLVWLGLLSPVASAGQERPDPPPFLGETLRYALSVMGIAGGELTLSAFPSELSGRPAYKFEMSAVSNAFFSKMFLVRDFLASWVDPGTFRSLRFEKHTVEGKRVRDELIEFDYERGFAVREGKSIPIEGDTLDTLSSIYYLRTLDLDAKEPIAIQVVSRRQSELRVEIQARETVTTPAGTFQTVRVEPKSEGAGLIGKGKNLVLWLTNDSRKIPVQLRSKLKVGTLLGKLIAINHADPAEEKQAASP
jgi:hypothetical protein